MDTFFSEKQKFTQWWLWIILIGIIGTTSYGAISQLVFGKPFGDKPASDAGLLLLLVFISLLLILLRNISLTTQITAEGIACKLFPFHFSYRVFKWTEVSNCYVRKYSPIIDYGGWGIKYGLKGLAYNISGNFGIQLELKSGSKILIGTQKPDEVKKLLDEIKSITFQKKDADANM
jgi:hypothetical protein